MSSSARYKCHGPINQEYSLRDHEPHHRNFRPQQIEESDNDINREDLVTLPKPERVWVIVESRESRVTCRESRLTCRD